MNYSLCIIIVMIEVNSLNCSGLDGELYKVCFHRLGFLLFPAPDLTSLETFSLPNQRLLGKTSIRFNLTAFLKYPQFFANVNYILLTDYQEALFIPFLLKMFPKVIIIATSLVYQLARITLVAFQETLADFDATSQQPDFFKQSQILEKYETELDQSFEDWRRVYSKQDVANALEKIVKVNYYQFFNTERGVNLRAFPSGKNNGGCIWQIHSIISNEKILLVNGVSQYNWRTCQSLDLMRLKQSQQQCPYKLIVLTKKALEIKKQREETKLAEIIKKINTNADSGISTTVVLADDTLCIDVIPRLAVRPEGKIEGIILSHESLHSFHNFVNSYADFLSPHYREQLFCQTPDYPLLHYSKLRDKDQLIVGSFEELTLKRKLPLREVVSQSHPFVQFVTSYNYYLNQEDLRGKVEGIKHTFEEISLGGNFNGKILSDFLAVFGRTKVVGFSEGNSAIECLQIGKKYNLQVDKGNFYYISASNSTKSIFQNFTLVNNTIQLSKTSISLLKLPKNWTELLISDLRSNGVNAERRERNKVSTGSTLVSINDRWCMSVVGSNGEELLLIEKWLNERGQKYVLP